MEHLHSVWTWIGFTLFLIIALSIDTLVIGRYRARQAETWRTALFWTLFWICTALIFNYLLWCYLYTITDANSANQYALNFLTAWLVEKSLSLDNLFVIYLIFQYFDIPANLQHRVLSYGLWGAVIMRLVMILGGIWLIAKFHWLLYVMGAFLVYTGLRIVLFEEKKKVFTDSIIYRLCKKIFKFTHEFSGQQFFVKKKNSLYATPLFMALVFVEFSDLIFACDSIPAVFAITRDPFIVWSSNIFAILGLRAMYFLLARLVNELEMIKYGIAMILMFVGVKMLIEPWFEIPTNTSLGVIISTIMIFTLLSLWMNQQQVNKK